MFPEEFLPAERKLKFGFSGRWFNNCNQLPSGFLNTVIFLGYLGYVLMDVLSILPQKLALFPYVFRYSVKKAAWWSGRAWVWELGRPGFSQSSFSSDWPMVLSGLLNFSET